MENNRVLAALCYFSILFAPFLLPIIVFFVTQDKEVKYHAKRSLLSHLIPIGLMVIGIVLLIFTTINTHSYMNSYSYYTEPTGFFWAAGLPFVFMIAYFIVSLIIMIWNIIQGVKVLK